MKPDHNKREAFPLSPEEKRLNRGLIVLVGGIAGLGLPIGIALTLLKHLAGFTNVPSWLITGISFSLGVGIVDLYLRRREAREAADNEKR